jgi:hypothetical protein
MKSSHSRPHLVSARCAFEASGDQSKVRPGTKNPPLTTNAEHRNLGMRFHDRKGGCEFVEQHIIYRVHRPMLQS